ncbi:MULTISPECIES: ApeI family dehydratase [unclassified Agarivorans]|uniref:ApeI family dehydratase n=1 Tax=unclassified Agarivorans TaxID=2636026 RepID=UPI0026E3ED71|nr:MULTISPECIES: thioester dehydrase [unclassified Agarivorans]MDO6685294.1 thioester dehydrase [Agarivorans sp. 3_MG-2023]MDO6715534.1 thioester dehydrase [Agarivorans sp. 2_MG-2023]
MKKFGVPTVESVEDVNGSVNISLFIAADLPCLQGHFPNLPVVPGVAQLHWAIEFATEYLNVPSKVVALEALKYQHVMQPNCRLQLSLRFDKEKSKLYFSYFNENNKYSSGRVQLGFDDV